MKFYPDYTVFSDDGTIAPFPATVPGNVQADRMAATPGWIDDIHYALSFEKFLPLEDVTWYYRADLPEADGQPLRFVTEGIDYRWDLALLFPDGSKKLLHEHEGMFSRVKIPLGAEHPAGTRLEITIHPHPKREGRPRDREQASACVKPPVSYEWDWHPRLLSSGIWDDTYVETVPAHPLTDCRVTYRMNDDNTAADVLFSAYTEGGYVPITVTLTDPAGNVVFSSVLHRGEGDSEGILSYRLDNPVLWWCRGLGEPNCYRCTFSTDEESVEQTVGFRSVKLVMTEGSWAFPKTHPMSRSDAPAQILLNGVPVFAKGSNYVSQSLFPGTVTAEQYEETIRMALDANMNIFRCWGGSGFQKDAFYELCDRLGMMLWVEFPLACNDYPNEGHYLTVLEQEATAALKKLAHHPSIVLWCGGNELFNSWSGMTDQSHALRLLNKLTYEWDRDTPFLMTSPLNGMMHGGYTFQYPDTGDDVFTTFARQYATAYTEFGVSGVADEETLRSILPADELFPPENLPRGSWRAHHGFDAWGDERWLCLPTLKQYGPVDSLQNLIEISSWTQSMGYKGIFEEARRQKPHCAMAINWCWCEPWKCAANNSLIGFPNRKKPAYFAVRDSLRDVVGSVGAPRFSWYTGEDMTLSLWLLNDSPAPVKGTLSVYAGGTLVAEETLSADRNRNARGNDVTFRVPVLPTPEVGAARFPVRVILRTDGGETVENDYEFALFSGEKTNE